MVSIKEEKVYIKKCEVCGEENPLEASVCGECGAKLIDADAEVKSIDEAEPVEEIHSEEKKQVSPKKAKKLSGPVIFFSWIFLLAAGGVMLYGSGTFDEVPPADLSSLQGDFDDLHKGAEMQSLQQINQLRQVVEAEPENYAALLDLAHLLGDSGFFDKAVERYNTYLAANPNETDVWVDLGVCYFELEDYGKATDAMQKALDLDPEHLIAHFNMGIVKFSEGDVETAKDWWLEVVEMKPESNIAIKAKELIEQN